MRERIVQQHPSRQAIRPYRIYLIDSTGHIAKAHDVEATSDEEARELAQLMLAEQSDHPIVEVWDRARTVCRLP